MDEHQKQQIKKWIEALRSGEYQQAQDALRRFDEFDEDEDKYCYCCLGVACQISGIGDWDDNEYRDSKGFSDGYLSPQVSDYYGLTHEEQVELAKMNDCGLSFDTIADSTLAKAFEPKLINMQNLNLVEEESLYRHFKGGTYYVHFVTADAEADEVGKRIVVYQKAEIQADGSIGLVLDKLWYRSIENFCSTVEVDGESVLRFTSLSSEG